MAMQFSVFVLASLLFVAHALTGLRKRAGSQVDAFQVHNITSPAVCNEQKTGNGADYRGCQTKTSNGRTCQSWTVTSPHSHTKTCGNYPNKGLCAPLLPNACRNPDGESTIWCYTTDSATRWETCAPLPFPAPDELGCPSLRFPSYVRCRIIRGPCKKHLTKCDEFYANHPLAPSSAYKCEMAQCLSQAPYQDSASPAVQDPRTFGGRSANAGGATGSIAAKATDALAVLCNKSFMKTHKSKADTDLMRCFTDKARLVQKRPLFETTTTTGPPTPANWYCVPSINFDRRGGREIIKQVAGPFKTIDLAKAQLDSTWGSFNLEQFICEMRVANKYDNTYAAGTPGLTFPLTLANVTQTPHILGPPASIAAGNPTIFGQYVKPSGGWGATIDQTIANGFNIGCKVVTNPTAAQTVQTCPHRTEMLDMCQNDYKCNLASWR